MVSGGGGRLLRLPFVAAAAIVSALLLFFCPAPPVASADLASDEAALLAFLHGLDGAPSSLTQNWSSSSSSPCSWVGVVCSSAAVIELRLPSSGLYGSIQPNTLSRLASLQVISLRSNHLSAPLPLDLLHCTRLRKLFLHNNLLSGPLLPFDSSSTPSLSAIDLSFNRFSSSIPSSLSSLQILRILLLQHNNLSASIPPDLGYSTALLHFNVSDNLLSGAVPPPLTRFPASSFSGNAALCGPPTPSSCAAASPAPPPSAAPRSSGGGGVLSVLDIALIVVADVSIVMLVAACCWVCRLRRQIQEKGKTTEEGKKKKGGSGRWLAMMLCRKKGGGDEEEGGAGGGGRDGMEEEEDEAVVAKEAGSNVNKLVFFRSGGAAEEGAAAAARESFDLEDLLRASAEILGKGGFGTVYRAVLEGGQRLVVKRLKQVAAGRKEFEQQMEAAARLRHPNLLSLRAYYFSKDEKLLVYDYLPLGTLAASLYGPKKRELAWEARLKAAVGAGRGLAAIHASGPKMAHGTVKSSNIILDAKKGGVLADYGLSGLFSAGTAPARMSGYRAPELMMLGSASPTHKSDVYAFGVVLLELLTAREAAQMFEEGMDLPRWVNAVVREEWTAEVFDKDLLRLATTVEEELVQLLHLALACVVMSPEKRPAMTEVLDGLLGIRPGETTLPFTSSASVSASASVSSASPPPPPPPPTQDLT